MKIWVNREMTRKTPEPDFFIGCIFWLRWPFGLSARRHHVMNERGDTLLWSRRIIFGPFDLTIQVGQRVREVLDGVRKGRTDSRPEN